MLLLARSKFATLDNLIAQEPAPGTTYNAIMKEVQYLDEFLAMLKQKHQLDQHHLNNLQAIRAYCDPKWLDSSIGALLSPILDSFDREIAARLQANELFDTYIAEAVAGPTWSHSDKGDFNVLNIYQYPKDSYEDYLRCHQAVTDPNSLSSHQSWLQKCESTTEVISPSDMIFQRMSAIIEEQ